MDMSNPFTVSPPTLDRWEVRRHTLSGGRQPVFEVTCIGWCNRRRRPLFTHTEVVTPSEGHLKVSDVAHHYALVCEQDRPTSQAQFDRGLMGAAWDQAELPF